LIKKTNKGVKEKKKALSKEKGEKEILSKKKIQSKPKEKSVTKTSSSNHGSQATIITTTTTTSTSSNTCTSSSGAISTNTSVYSNYRILAQMGAGALMKERDPSPNTWCFEPMGGSRGKNATCQSCGNSIPKSSPRICYYYCILLNTGQPARWSRPCSKNYCLNIKCIYDAKEPSYIQGTPLKTLWRLTAPMQQLFEDFKLLLTNPSP